jgi:hypothetical protein
MWPRRAGGARARRAAASALYLCSVSSTCAMRMASTTLAQHGTPRHVSFRYFYLIYTRADSAASPSQKRRRLDSEPVPTAAGPAMVPASIPVPAAPGADATCVTCGRAPRATPVILCAR